MRKSALLLGLVMLGMVVTALITSCGGPIRSCREPGRKLAALARPPLL